MFKQNQDTIALQKIVLPLYTLEGKLGLPTTFGSFDSSLTFIMSI